MSDNIKMGIEVLNLDENEKPSVDTYVRFAVCCHAYLSKYSEEQLAEAFKAALSGE